MATDFFIALVLHLFIPCKAEGNEWKNEAIGEITMAKARETHPSCDYLDHQSHKQVQDARL